MRGDDDSDDDGDDDDDNDNDDDSNSDDGSDDDDRWLSLSVHGHVSCVAQYHASYQV